MLFRSASVEIRDRLVVEAFEPIGSTPAALATYMRSEFARWAKVVKDSGARID